MQRFLFLLFLLFSSSVVASDFQSNFKENNFCNFDLQRMPYMFAADLFCGPEFLSYAKIIKHQELPYVAVTLHSSVPFTAKYKYKMELSVPKEKNYYPEQTTEHRFSLILPKLPDTKKIFPHLSENATAFVLAQWHACNDKSPPLALRLLNSKELIITIDIDKANSKETERVTLWRGAAIPEVVLRFSVLAHWSTEQGKLNIELNGQNIVDYVGAIGQRMEASPAYYFKYGLYHSYKDKIAEDFNFTVLLGDMSQVIILP